MLKREKEGERCGSPSIMARLTRYPLTFEFSANPHLLKEQIELTKLIASNST